MVSQRGERNKPNETTSHGVIFRRELLSLIRPGGKEKPTEKNECVFKLGVNPLHFGQAKARAALLRDF